jgi:hypothetical protein
MLVVNVPRGPRRVLETLGLTDLTRYDRGGQDPADR